MIYKVFTKDIRANDGNFNEGCTNKTELGKVEYESGPWVTLFWAA